MEPFLVGKRGLEIGGPSAIFSSNRLIPVYDRCLGVDSCNFSPHTIWTSSAGQTGWGTKFGRELVAEACDLSIVADETYDFVIASHVLEHIANPLRAMAEWRRVLRTHGALLIIVPDRRYTFDHKRPFTTFEHIEADYAANTGEDDLTHLEEILSLHDLGVDPLAGSREQFRNRCLQNLAVRAMHHHVFSPEVLSLMFEGLDLRVLNLTRERPYHIIGFAQKPDTFRHQ
jgi:SAM-dependent methyltransferase